MPGNRFPPGWDQARVERVLAHYEGQPDEEAMVEDEAALQNSGQTLMVLPANLVPQVRALIAKRRA
jgi:hypothetical protein